MNVIEMKNVSKVFNDTKIAVNNVSVEIPAGQVFGLLGKSGAGKTSIIKMLTTQMRATSGEIRVFGIDVRNWTKKQYVRLGVMSDDFGIYEKLTCMENMKLFEKIYRLSEGTAQSALSEVGLSEAWNTKVCDLSKGMRQRLSFARATVHSPELLFLDEPTSDLDPINTEKIHNIINNLKESGTTIFLTTHNMREAERLCDYIGLLNNGILIKYGTPESICMSESKENKIIVRDHGGHEYIFDNIPQNAIYISEFIKNDNLNSIHSSELSLDDIFIRLENDDESDNRQS